MAIPFGAPPLGAAGGLLRALACAQHLGERTPLPARHPACCGRCGCWASGPPSPSPTRAARARWCEDRAGRRARHSGSLTGGLSRCASLPPCVPAVRPRHPLLLLVDPSRPALPLPPCAAAGGPGARAAGGARARGHHRGLRAGHLRRQAGVRGRGGVAHAPAGGAGADGVRVARPGGQGGRRGGRQARGALTGQVVQCKRARRPPPHRLPARPAHPLHARSAPGSIALCHVSPEARSVLPGSVLPGSINLCHVSPEARSTVGAAHPSSEDARPTRDTRTSAHKRALEPTATPRSGSALAAPLS
jgi:hypothetical protein